MTVILFAASVLFLVAGHLLRMRRWSTFIKIYEHPPVGALLRSMSLGYTLNFFLPLKLGDLFRAFYAGKRMKNGVGFSLATVFVDRFLDVWVVAILFALLSHNSAGRDAVTQSARFYYIASIALLIFTVLALVLSSYIKRITLILCSIFNDRIRLRAEKFFWTLINTFRDIKNVRISRIALNTAGMWAFYLCSYYLYADFMKMLGSEYSLSEIVLSLFSVSSIDLSALMIAVTSSSGLTEQLCLIAYILLPSVILFMLSQINRSGWEKETDSGDGEYLRILPQLDEKDQLSFLDDYFSARRPEIIKQISVLNRNVSIISDYSSGSNASTLLCMDGAAMFYRKYAFGKDGEKLAEQLSWLEAHMDSLPLCEIIRSDSNADYCCYDMSYMDGTAGFFTFVHSHPAAEGKKILLSVIESVRQNLHTLNSSPAPDECIDEYISRKVSSNLDTVLSSRALSSLMKYDRLIINNTEYINLPELAHMFQPEHLREIFSNDRRSDIHGDLTIENIICCPDSRFYLIDPNTGNILDSPFLDYAKLLQSLHGGYEFMMKTSSVRVCGNRIDFVYTRSAVYDELLECLDEYLRRNFSCDEIRSIYYHELVHWLRLIPYKLRKDAERAPMFYAGLVMITNDVYKRWEKDRPGNGRF